MVRLKGGDSYVFGRGYEELLACAQAGVPVTVVPGVTSAFAVPAVAGVPVTHRGVAHEVVVVSGHVGPQDERSLVDWNALARLRGTIVLLMGLQRIEAFAKALIGGGRPAETPVLVVADGTMRTERVVRSTLDEVAEVVAAQPTVCGTRNGSGSGTRGVPDSAGNVDRRVTARTQLRSPRFHT